MSLQENIKKKIFVPPLNHSGGGHFGCPPPELLRRGTILRGGTVPPLKLLRGGQSPSPPPVSALEYIVSFLNSINSKLFSYYLGGRMEKKRLQGRTAPQRVRESHFLTPNSAHLLLNVVV